jgi:hypothetical protein
MRPHLRHCSARSNARTNPHTGEEWNTDVRRQPHGRAHGRAGTGGPDARAPSGGGRGQHPHPQLPGRTGRGGLSLQDLRARAPESLLAGVGGAPAARDPRRERDGGLLRDRTVPSSRVLLRPAPARLRLPSRRDLVRAALRRHRAGTGRRGRGQLGAGGGARPDDGPVRAARGIAGPAARGRAAGAAAGSRAARAGAGIGVRPRAGSPLPGRRPAADRGAARTGGRAGGGRAPRATPAHLPGVDGPADAGAARHPPQPAPRKTGCTSSPRSSASAGTVTA